MTADLQIGAAARRLEITLIGGDATAVAAVDGIAGDAFAVRPVDVSTPGITAGQRRIAQAAIDRAPCLLWRAIDRQRAAAPMSLAVAELLIVLDDREERHDLARGPAGAAVRRPFIEGIGDTADGDLAVHHRAAAKPLAAPVEARLLACDAASQEIGPLPLLLEFALVNDRDRIRRHDLPGRLIGAPVEPRFQQQHPPVAVFR